MRENASFRDSPSDELGYLSSQPRYDHFDILPYLVVFEFCTAFARPKLKCIHPKFKKNEAFGRYCEKTRAFATHQVMSSATFRVIGSCCATHVMTTSPSLRRRRYLSVFKVSFDNLIYYTIKEEKKQYLFQKKFWENNKKIMLWI